MFWLDGFLKRSTGSHVRGGMCENCVKYDSAEYTITYIEAV